MVRVAETTATRSTVEMADLSTPESARAQLTAPQEAGSRAGCVAVFAALGGFLFGLDIGYISGVEEMASFADDINGGEPLTDATQGFITGAFSIGAVATAFPPVAGAIIDRLGRKLAISSGGALFCIGALIQALSSDLVQMDVGRALAGASIGILSTNVPVYQSEVAAPRRRGACVALYQLAITVGITVAFWLNWALSAVPNGWRISILAQLLPGGCLALGMLAMPRSPRWLISKGRVGEARAALVWLRGGAAVDSGAVDEELAAAKAEAEREAAAATELRWSDFCRGTMSRLAPLGVLLQLLQQLCGMNAFMYYGPRIFALIQSGGEGEAGDDGERRSVGEASFLFTGVNGVVMVLSTLPGVFLVDRLGRCKLLRLSAAGMGVSCLVLGVTGTTCIENHGCGIAASGAIFFFVFNFAYGWGPVVWIYCSEMFPLLHRSRATGLTTMANWAGNFCLAFFPPLLISAIGYGTFFVFAAFCGAGFALACWLPETKGKSLEEIATMFDERLKPSDLKARVAGMELRIARLEAMQSGDGARGTGVVSVGKEEANI